MKLLKLLVLGLAVSSLATVVDAKPPKDKQLPPGLQKKVERGGQLPPGWQKKLAKGVILEPTVYAQAVPIAKKEYKAFGGVIEGTVVVRVDDRVLRLARATHEIIDILK
ncbi:MAG: hypothetical protein OEY19_04950 [Gammaproteobacteria bacterium]|nr:hypothetical protein [Gammaproteobacteria bacterium]MDH5628829.1 hypothetical protein [Gammaproteobacteria bacterium]